MDDDLAPAPCRSIEVLVYVREHGACASPEPVGYDATITVGANGLAGVTLRPLTDPANEWAITSGSAFWRMAEGFVMTLPALRAHALLRPATRVA